LRRACVKFFKKKCGRGSTVGVCSPLQQEGRGRWGKRSFLEGSNAKKNIRFSQVDFNEWPQAVTRKGGKSPTKPNPRENNHLKTTVRNRSKHRKRPGGKRNKLGGAGKKPFQFKDKTGPLGNGSREEIVIPNQERRDLGKGPKLKWSGGGNGTENPHGRGLEQKP